jgi:subtilisin-like proprotein convertase family protein
MRRQTLFLAALPCLLLAASARAASPVPASDAPNATPSLLRELDRGAEELPILIGVRDGTPSARALRASPNPEREPERRVIRMAAQKRLAEELTPQRLAVKHYYESFSILAGTATRETAIALAGRTDVAWVDLDRRAHLLQTTPQSSQILVRSDQTNALGIRGAGQAIAVIDTGVDYMVADLGGAAFPNTKVIGGTDIADKDSDPMDCDGHGTSIAGVAAGPRGVAPDAKIVAIKVFSSKDATNATCQDTASFSDIIAGINFAITNKTTFEITAINISLGGSFDDSLDHGYCDGDDPGSTAAIDAATAAGMVVVVAAGNDGLTNQLSVPACVSSAVSVGAVYPESRARVSWSDGVGGILCTDQPANPDGIVCFSNSTSNLSLLAPGAFWNVVTKGGGQDSFSGTSPATAAVSGAVVLLRQARPDLSPVGLVGVLRSTGKPIADSRNGVVTPRIDTLAAVQLAASGFAISPATAVDIPDGSGSATATATISGFTRPLANVQVWVEINHPSPEQLRVTLIGPDGTSVVLQDQTGQDEHPINAIYGKTDATAQSLGAFAGKLANGIWTLKVEDLVAGVTGRIKAFEVTPIPLAERQSISKRSTSAARVPRRVNSRP